VLPRGPWLAGIVVAGVLGAAGPAPAAVRVLDPKAADGDALRGVVVWHRDRGRDLVLMRRIAGRTSRVPGVPPARSFGSVDLGLDARGRVIASYARCDERPHCRPYVADVRRGGERRHALPRHRGCRAPGATSQWGSRIAYTLICPGSARGGVYVARGGRTRRVLPLTGGVEIDLGRRLLSASNHESVWATTVDARCRRRLAAPDMPPGVAYRAAHVAGNRVWWLHQVVEDFGGGAVELHGVVLGPRCSAPAEPARDLSHLVFDPWVEDFGIDRSRLYIALPFGDGIVSLRLGELGPPTEA
jgi:hypothetical protein